MSLMRGRGSGMAGTQFDICQYCGKKGVMEGLRTCWINNRPSGEGLYRYCKYCRAGAFMTGPCAPPDGAIVHGEVVGAGRHE